MHNFMNTSRLLYRSQWLSSPRNQSSVLDQLKKVSVISADTSDFGDIQKHKPTDATTNPSLTYAASKIDRYAEIIETGIEYGKCQGGSKYHQFIDTNDYINVRFGTEILKLIPGRVSTEVDASLSFDTKGSVAKAIKIIELYEQLGVKRDRVLIKLASTWECIRAGEILEKEHNIHCNMTLIFCLMQAAACAEAGVTLISPFVGRIYDWFAVKTGVKKYDDPLKDPGVKSTTNIYNYYKKFDYKTEVMAASFRNKEQIKGLAGCDLLTISPQLMKELADEKGELKTQLCPAKAKEQKIKKLKTNECEFRWQLHSNEMASEKLSQGIRAFHADTIKLHRFLCSKLKNKC